MTAQTNLELVWALNAGVSVADPGDTKYTNGWGVEIPPHEHFNFVLQNNSKNILVMAEDGHHTWDIAITYQPGARVKYSGQFYTCAATSTGDVPSSASSFWSSGILVGDAAQSDTDSRHGMHIKNVQPRTDTASWDGNDLTLTSKLPLITMNGTVGDNWSIGNVGGVMCLINQGAVTLPNGTSKAVGQANTYKIYHEGNPPSQGSVDGAVEEAPNNSNGYIRKALSWAVHNASSGSEANTGTNNTNFVSPKTLNDSDYIKKSAIVDLIYPVGSVLESTLSTNPNARFSGTTWVAFGTGRVTVAIDAGNANFNINGETGGSKDAIAVTHSHTASSADAGNHRHSILTYGDGGEAGNIARGSTINASTRYSEYAGTHSHTVTVNSAGSSGTDKNLQPYIVVYRWKRTA